MTEEKLKNYIEGKRQASEASNNPFKVPEGYFDTLCDRVMARLPEQQVPVRRTLVPRHLWRYAAAIVIGAVVCAGVLIPGMKGGADVQLANSTITQEVEQAYYDEQYVIDELDYAMVGNNEIALYLTEN